MADESAIFPSAADLSFGGVGPAPLVPAYVPVPRIEPERRFQTAATYGVPQQAPAAPVQMGPVPSVEGVAEAARPSMIEAAKARLETASAERRKETELDTEARRLLLGGADELRRLGVAIDEGNDVGRTRIARLAEAGLFSRIEMEYGPEAAEAVLNLHRQGAVDSIQQGAERSAVQTGTDNVLSAGAAAIAGLGGIAAIGGGLLNDQLGATIAQGTENLAEPLRNLRSERIQTSDEFSSIRRDLDREDRRRDYEADLADGGSDMMAMFRRAGDEIVDTATELYENPEQAGRVVSEGIGSLISGGVIGKALKVGERAFPLVIGALEAGGSYSDIQAQIQSMSESELMEGSSAYRELRAEDMSHSEAVDRLANRAGLEGATMAGVLGTVSGALVAKFEANPLGFFGRDFRERGLVAALQDVGRETMNQSLEEVIQSGAAPLITNVAVQRYADEDRDLTEGIGEGAVEGLIGGAGMVGVLRTPDIVGGATRDVTRVTRTAIEEARARQDARNPVGNQAREEAGARITEAFAAVTVPVDAPVATPAEEVMEASEGEAPEAPTETQNQEEAPAAETTVESRLRSVNRMAVFTREDVAAMNPDQRQVFLEPSEDIPADQPVPRHVAWTAAVEAAIDTKKPKAVRMEAALFLQTEAEKLQDLLDGGVDDMPENVRPGLEAALGEINIWLANKQVKETIELATQVTAEDFGPLPEVTPETKNSPEVRAATERMVRIATANPAGVNPDFVDLVLDQVDPVQASALIAAATLVREGAKGEAAKSKALDEFEVIERERIGPKEAKKARESRERKNWETVRADIEKGGQDEGYRHPGLNKHVRRITGAMLRGNPEQAKNYAEVLGNFARHMDNKLSAANRSAALRRGKDNKISYETWTGDTFVKADSDGANAIFVNPYSAAGVQHWQEVAIDAATVRNTYNALVKAFPELGLKARPDVDTPNFKALLKKKAEATTDGQSAGQKGKGDQQGKGSESQETQSQEQTGEDAAEGTTEQGSEGTGSDGSAPAAGSSGAESAPRTRSGRVAGTDLRVELRARRAALKTKVKELKKTLREGKAKIKKARVKEEIEAFAEVVDALETEIDILEQEDKTYANLIRGSTEATRGTGRTRREAQRTDPRPEPVTEEPVTSGAAETGDVVEDRFPESGPRELDTAVLIKDRSGLNRFVRGFKINPKKSVLARYAGPGSVVLNYLKNFAKYSEEDGLAFRSLMDEGKIAIWRKLVLDALKDSDNNRSLVTLLEERLNRTVTTKIGDRDMTPAEAVTRATADVLSWRKFRHLALTEQVQEGEDFPFLRYNPRLAQGAVLGALHWNVTTTSEQNLKDEDIVRIYKVEMEEVGSIRNLVNSGLSMAKAKESLAQTIVQFWGAETSRKVPLDDLVTISENLAAELLTVMAEKGMIRIATTTLVKLDETTGKIRNQDIYVVQPRHEGNKDLMTAIGGSRGFLAEAFVPEAKQGWIFGAPQNSERETQKKNKVGKLGSRVRDAIRVQEDAPYFQNQPMLGLMRALGKDNWLKLRGYRNVEKGLFNRLHAESVEGTNIGLMKGWDHVMDHAQQLAAWAENRTEGEKDPAKIPTHFSVYAGLNGRMMMEGPNVQAQKPLREYLISTWSVLDLSEPGSVADNQFWMTVAQSIGVKTEKGTRETNVAAAKARIETLRIAVEVVKAHLLDAETEMEAEGVELLVQALGTNVSDKMLHALVSVAQYELAHEAVAADPTSTALKAFRHGLALEADGKTDGPINAIVNFATGSFNAAWIEMVRRGGLFLNETGRTLNSYFNVKGAKDLYEMAADRANLLMSRRREALKRQSREIERMVRAIDFLAIHFSPFLESEAGRNEKGDEVVLTRSNIKNPMTMVGYGSGEKGLAGKMTGLMLDNVYAKMTELALLRNEPGGEGAGLGSLYDAETAAKIEAALKLLTSKAIVWNQNKEEWFAASKTKSGAEPKALKSLADPVNFSLDLVQIEMLKTNLLAVYAEPMSAGISQTMGSAKVTLELFQKATQLMSVVMQARFKAEVDRVLKAKRAEGKLGKSEFLTTEDYENIFREMSKFGAIIEGIADDENTLNLSIKERGESSEEFSQAMDGRFKTAASLPSPREAGVSAQPMLTISRGDARMMVNFYAMENIRELGGLKTVQVYDGLEMPADGMDSISELINQAVVQSWLENPAQDVADSFADWIRQNQDGVMDGLDEAVQKQILDAVYRGGEVPTGFRERENTNAQQVILIMRNRLYEVAREIQARKNVLARMALSGDHMASGERPYDQQGEIFEVANDDQLADSMNAMLEEELAKLPRHWAPKDEKAPVVEPSNAELTARLEAYGTREEGTGVTMMSSDKLFVGLDTEAVSRPHRVILKGLSKLISGYRVVMGSPEQIAAWKEQQDMTENFGEGPAKSYVTGGTKKPLGQTDLRNKVIYLSNISGETATHELLHAALGGLVHGFYTDREKLTGVQKSALVNLEKMMRQFGRMNFTLDHPEQAQAAEAAQTEIRNALGQRLDLLDGVYDGKFDIDLRRTKAMLEFISWVMTNQNLGDVLGRVKVKDRLRQFVGKSLEYVRNLLGFGETVPLDMFSQVRSNTGFLLQSLAKDGEAAGMNVDLVLDQVAPVDMVAPPMSNRVKYLRENFEEKVATHLREIPLAQKMEEEVANRMVSREALARFEKAGWIFTDAEARTFEVMQQAFASAAEMAPASMARAQRVVAHLLGNLKVEDFMDDPTDPLEPRGIAEAKFEQVVGKGEAGKSGSETDMYGRSNIVASFLALASVNDEFRAVLEKKQLPKDRELDRTSIDAWIGSVGNSMMNTLGGLLSQEGSANNPDAVRSIDRLVTVLARTERDERSQVEKTVAAHITGAETWIVRQEQKLADRLSEFSDVQENEGKLRETLRAGAKIAAGLIDERRADNLAEQTLSLSNTMLKHPLLTPLRNLVTEIIGSTENVDGDPALGKAPLLGLLVQSKALLSQARQRFRKVYPEVLAEQFTRKLKDHEWSAMHHVWAQTDVAFLRDGMSLDRIMELTVNSSKLSREIRGAREKLVKLSKNDPFYVQKAGELAHWMVTGKAPKAGQTDLLMNAEAIAWGLGTYRFHEADRNGGPMNGLADAIDVYASLLALEMTRTEKPEMWQAVEALVQEEAEGVRFMISTLHDMRRGEVNKLRSTATRLNGKKGYAPAEKADAARLIVAEDSDKTMLEMRGYTRLGDYEGSGHEKGRRGYYYAPSGGPAAFQQGALQTVHMTAMGVDMRTGLWKDSTSGKPIIGEELLELKHRMNQGKRPIKTKGNETLVPIWREDGSIAAYERTMDPEMIQKLQKNDNLGEMLGAWAGRQFEEQESLAFNEGIVQAMKRHWDLQKNSPRANEFVQVDDTTLDDPVMRDAWKVLPQETQQYAKAVFGEDGVMVRMDLHEQMLGYRLAAPQEIWEGATRMPEKLRKGTQVALETIGGKYAFKTLDTAFTEIQGLVGLVKNTIIIRSMIIPAINAVGNVRNLMELGVGLRAITKGYGAKLLEANQYLQNAEETDRIQVMLARYRDDVAETLKLEARLKALQDANKRMSIWPLIEGGEFGSLSDGQTEVDNAIRDGRLAIWIKGKAEKLPDITRTLGDYAVVSERTALFQGLARATQYGDFIAKSIAYDHLTKVNKAPKEHALNRVREMFVAYSFLPGRARALAESTGITWFWAWKIRMMKQALNMLRRNPLRVMSIGYGLEHVEVPALSDNAVLQDHMGAIVFQDGRFERSVGWGMLWDAHEFNPWLNGYDALRG